MKRIQTNQFLLKMIDGYKLIFFLFTSVLNIFAIFCILRVYLMNAILQSPNIFYQTKEFWFLCVLIVSSIIHRRFFGFIDVKLFPLLQKRVRIYLYDYLFFATKTEVANKNIKQIDIILKGFFQSLEYSITGFLVTIFTFIQLFRINKYIFLLSSFFLIINIIALYIRLNINQTKQMDQEENTAKIIQNTLSNNQIANAFTCRDFILKKIMEECTKSEKEYSAVQKKIDQTNELTFITFVLVGYGLSLAGFSWIIYTKKSTYANTFELFGYFLQFLGWTWWALGSLRTTIGNYKDLNETIKSLEYISDTNMHKKIPESFKGYLEIKNLTFSYDESKPILKNINLIIKPGDHWCITGKSGTGKSTLLRLLSRQINPPVNTIFLDGNDITTLDINWYKKHIGFIFQSNIFYKDTVINNILLGREISQEHIDFCAKQIKAYDFIQEKEKKYEEFIENDNFSGGQMQRLSILRAIVGNPSIIFGDEPSSALDSHTEEEVFNNVLSYAEEKKQTVILITHNKSLMNRFTKIIDLNNLI